MSRRKTTSRGPDTAVAEPGASAASPAPGDAAWADSSSAPSAATRAPPDPASLEAARGLIEATGSLDQDLARRLAEQVAECLWLPAELDEAERQSRLAAALAALRAIGPTSVLEGLLASHMVAAHGAALECLRRAMAPDQLAESRETNLRQASKLMGLFARQLETLDRHRTKGKRKVTVEHVKVEGLKVEGLKVRQGDKLERVRASLHKVEER